MEIVTQRNASGLQLLNTFTPQSQGSIILEVQDFRLDRWTTQETAPTGNREADLEAQIGFPTLGWSNEQDTPWTGDEPINEIRDWCKGEVDEFCEGQTTHPLLYQKNPTVPHGGKLGWQF